MVPVYVVERLGGTGVPLHDVSSSLGSISGDHWQIGLSSLDRSSGIYTVQQYVNTKQ